MLLNPPPPRPHDEFTSSALPLGKPMHTGDASVVSSIPAHLQLRAPRSPNRVHTAEQVDIGIPSVYGSVGYLPSMMSHNPSVVSPDPDTREAGHDRTNSEVLDLLVGHAADHHDAGTVAEDRKGKGKEVTTNTDAGALPGNGNGTDGPGSARTRVSMG